MSLSNDSIVLLSWWWASGRGVDGFSTSLRLVCLIRLLQLDPSLLSTEVTLILAVVVGIGRWGVDGRILGWSKSLLLMLSVKWRRLRVVLGGCVAWRSATSRPAGTSVRVHASSTTSASGDATGSLLDLGL